MPARLVSDNGEHVVIRPLAYVLESEARAYAKEANLPIIGCCCPACGDLSLQRQRMKRLIAQLEVEHPEIKNSILKALGNVNPRHLLIRAGPSAPSGARSGNRHRRGASPRVSCAIDSQIALTPVLPVCRPGTGSAGLQTWHPTRWR